MLKSVKGQARREEVSEVSRRLLMRHLQVLRRSLNCGLIRVKKPLEVDLEIQSLPGGRWTFLLVFLLLSFSLSLIRFQSSHFSLPHSLAITDFPFLALGQGIGMSTVSSHPQRTVDSVPLTH